MGEMGARWERDGRGDGDARRGGRREGRYDELRDEGAGAVERELVPREGRNSR
tara:strand:- start:463 stop:621 length:159 start_codon:yes stop_codon:yes gene_type:complete